MRDKKNNTNSDSTLMLIKRGKVEAQWRHSQELFTKLVCIPTIKFAGLWLHHYGFEAGKHFEVYAAKNQLVLKVGQRSTAHRPKDMNKEGRPDKSGENIIPLTPDRTSKS